MQARHRFLRVLRSNGPNIGIIRYLGFEISKEMRSDGWKQCAIQKGELSSVFQGLGATAAWTPVERSHAAGSAPQWVLYEEVEAMFMPV